MMSPAHTGMPVHTYRTQGSTSKCRIQHDCVPACMFMISLLFITYRQVQSFSNRAVELGPHRQAERHDAPPGRTMGGRMQPSLIEITGPSL